MQGTSPPVSERISGSPVCTDGDSGNAEFPPSGACTPPGGRVSLGAAREDGKVRLTVADNGVGIPPEHAPHVFDRFYKADQSRLHAGGSGLGLSIVKAIVERHGGTVAVRSRQGVETVFEILLPERVSRQSPSEAELERSNTEKMP